MHRKILHSLLSLLLVVTSWVSLASRIPIVSAAIQTAGSTQDTSGVEGNWRGALANNRRLDRGPHWKKLKT